MTRYRATAGYNKNMNENETVMDEKQIYEISFIFDNRLDETKALEKSEDLKKYIASLEGSFISEETPYMRELSYEMTRVVNNVNVRFSEGYFGWMKFELSLGKIEDVNKKLKLDEEVVRFLITKSEKGNDVFTKDKPIVKSDPTVAAFVREEAVLDNSQNIDTTISDTLEIEEIKEEITEDAKEGVKEEVIEEIKKESDLEVENI